MQKRRNKSYFQIQSAEKKKVKAEEELIHIIFRIGKLLRLKKTWENQALNLPRTKD